MFGSKSKEDEKHHSGKEVLSGDACEKSIGYGWALKLNGVNFADVVSKLQHELKKENFLVLNDIDLHSKLKWKLEYRIFEVCDPLLVNRILEVEPDFGLLLPINIVIRQCGSSGRDVCISFADPDLAFSAIHCPEMQTQFSQLKMVLHRVSEAVSGQKVDPSQLSQRRSWYSSQQQGKQSVDYPQRHIPQGQAPPSHLSSASYGWFALVNGAKFDDVLSKTIAELKKENFVILNEIDVRAKLYWKRHYRVLEVCDPRIIDQVLESEPDFGLLLPINIAVREWGSDGDIILSVADPDRSLSIINRPDLQPQISQIKASLFRVTEAVSGQRPDTSKYPSGYPLVGTKRNRFALKAYVQGAKFDDIITKIVAELKKENFFVLNDIDLQAKLRWTTKYRIIEVCDPRMINEVLESEPDFGLLLANNIVVREWGTDGDVILSISQPNIITSLLNAPEMQPKFDLVNAGLLRVLEAVSGRKLEGSQQQELGHGNRSSEPIQSQNERGGEQRFGERHAVHESVSTISVKQEVRQV
jgi:uncharacterized protein (DUF302 family)